MIDPPPPPQSGPPPPQSGGPLAPSGPPPCYRHPDHQASVVCGRCDRPICTDCMVQAPVGWQCPECVHQGAKTSRTVNPFRSGGARAMVGATPTPMVLILIGVNVICFLASGFGRTSVLDRFGDWPAAVHLEHQYYRLIDSMFLHVSVTHILFNMITLLIGGPAVELMLGRSRFLALYLLSGLGGGVLAYLIGPDNVVGVGASGAIFGVLGAYVVLARRRHVPMGGIPALLIINFVLDFTGVLGNVDVLAHIGGLVVGVVLALAYDLADNQRDRTRKVALVVGSSVLTLVVLGVLLVSIAPGQVNLG